jgi:hypothetical protein
MQNLGFRYTQYLNRKRKKTGHLFQGRYKALLIDADSYLLELVRYIHLNPVRAGMVTQPDAYPWSSHRTYLGLEKIPWLTTDWILGQFDRNSGDAIRRYGRFTADGLQEGYRAEFHGGSFEGRVLGDDRFIEEALAQAEEPVSRQPSIESVIEAVCSSCGLTIAEVAGRSRVRQVSEARAVAALLVREAESLTLVDLGKHLNHDLSSLSQAARRLELRVEDDSCLAERLETVKRKVKYPFVKRP